MLSKDNDKQLFCLIKKTEADNLPIKLISRTRDCIVSAVFCHHVAQRVMTAAWSSLSCGLTRHLLVEDRTDDVDSLSSKLICWEDY